MKQTMLLALLITSQVFANLQNVKIYDVVNKENEKTLIFGFDGKVYFSDVNLSKEELCADEGSSCNLLVEADDEHNLRQVYLEEPSLAVSAPSLIYAPAGKTEPHYLNALGFNDMWAAFRAQFMNINKNSQCFDRAHYWAHEWSQNSNLHSGKVFLFFTQRYIREYNYKWWFHVAPSFQNEKGQIVVLDPMFTNSPMVINNWTNLFVRSKAFCPEITHYNESMGAIQENQHCYIRHMPMYYYHPDSLRRRDLQGIWTVNWLSTEVNQAYQNVLYRR